MRFKPGDEVFRSGRRAFAEYVCTSELNVDMVRLTGADRVIDYTQEDFTRNGQRYDLTFDAVGNHGSFFFIVCIFGHGRHSLLVCECDGIRGQAIARGLRGRDPALLDRLTAQYQHRLFRYLVYLSGNRELAKDFFQETWLRVIERGHQYDGRHGFSTWLFAVSRNLVIDYLRKKSPVGLDGLVGNEQHAVFEPADTRPSASELLAQREQTEGINMALLSIPAQYREAVVLRFQEGLSLEETSRIIKAPFSTVKSRLYRGLNLLLGEMKGTQA